MPRRQVDSELEWAVNHYIETEILPQYAFFDPAHRIDHVRSVMQRSIALSSHYPEVNPLMVAVIAAYHDLGLSDGRQYHHLVSGQMLRNDEKLTQWFDGDEIETMAQAVEDHRASATGFPRSIYGCIVAEADRLIDPEMVIRRTLQYGLVHYPDLDTSGQLSRAYEHLLNKYSRERGYIKLWLPDSPNRIPLDVLQQLIGKKDEVFRLMQEILDALRPSVENL